MKLHRARRRGWCGLLAAGLALALLGGVASAGKPTKPPPPPPVPVDGGLIYYQDLTMTTWSMDPDGTNKQQATIPDGVEYGGYRWVLEDVWNRTEKRSELWVVREDGLDAFQLEFDPDVHPSKSYNANWADHGGAVNGKLSFLAFRFDENWDPIEYGLQVIYVDWTTRESTPAASLIPVGPYVYVPEDDYYWMSVEYVWSPTGASLIYNNSRDTDGLCRVDCDFATETWTTTVLPTGGWNLAWSPDGTRIAFTTYAGYTSLGRPLDNLETIAPDGTNRTMLVEGTRKVSAGPARWSPSGSHLVYAHFVFRSLTQPDMECDVYRITKDGEDATNLTADLSRRAWPLAWLDE